MEHDNTNLTEYSVSRSWLKSKQACILLGISKPTLYRWVRAQRIRARRIPTGEFRFCREDLENLLEG